MPDINSPFVLPCGTSVNNRMAKAAMTERIADRYNAPTPGHEMLYRRWSETNAGILITGNVMIDRVHLESAGNVCFDSDEMLPSLKRWARAGTQNGNQLWVQISHAGRQTSRFATNHPLAPSSIQLKRFGLFGRPGAMTDSDIEEVIHGFVRAAGLARKAGFTGIQIHAAHGYLLSEFLSPYTNRRDDRWGGNIDNRSRLLLNIVEGVRGAVGDRFPISVKINSSDFQLGGFTEEESLVVIRKLELAGIDLLEISGGTYEQSAFLLMNARESTRRREAYFIEFAKKVRMTCSVPLMVTGGFRSYDFCQEVLENGEVDFVGMARPFLSSLDEIRPFLNGELDRLDDPVIRTGISIFENAAEGGFHARQLIRLSEGKDYDPGLSALVSASFLVAYEFFKSLKRRNPEN